MKELNQLLEELSNVYWKQMSDSRGVYIRFPVELFGEIHSYLKRKAKAEANDEKAAAKYASVYRKNNVQRHIALAAFFAGCTHVRQQSGNISISDYSPKEFENLIESIITRKLGSPFNSISSTLININSLLHSK